MPFEAAKCPSCGAPIQVPNEMEQARCMYCGSNLLVREAIQKLKVEINGNVAVSGLSSVENDLERAQQSMSVHDFYNAYKYYCQAVDKQANNYSAWRGCLLAATCNFSSVDFSQIKIDGLMGLKSLVDNCLYYVPKEQKSILLRELEQLKGLMISLAHNEALPKLNNAKLSVRNKGKSNWVGGLIFGAIGLALRDKTVIRFVLDFLELPAKTSTDIFSLVFLGIAVLLILSGFASFRKLDIKTYLDPHKLSLSEYIGKVIAAANSPVTISG